MTKMKYGILEELKTVIKYEPFKRNKAVLALLWDLNGRNHEIHCLRLKISD